jgi:RNase P subunit RPR2
MHNHVYCICCKQVLASDKAKMTFRTGFYRIYPLAICQECKTVAFYPQQSGMERSTVHAH